MKLLLIDDDKLLRLQLKFSLEDLFDTILEASNTQEAMEHIKNHSIDVALVDLYLQNPDDGIIIAKEAVNSDIKTIVFTADKNETTIKSLIKEGVFDYLNKPVSIETLHSSLKRAKLFKTNEKELANDNIYHLNHCVDAKAGIKFSLTYLEKDLLVKILKQNDFNIYKTAKLLNVKRENIYYFIKKYQIDRV